MAQPQGRPRITEIQVRIDCNGCVQKIKKALQGISGISDVYIDLPQQKLTIIGWANPEKIIKAIKKARKNATIYSCSEVQEPPPAQPTDPTPSDNEAPPPPDNGNPTAEQSQPPQPVPPKDQPPSEPPKDQPPPTPAENQTANEQPPPPPPPERRADNEPPHHHVNPNKDVVEEVHVIHHHPPDSSYRPGFGPGYNHGPPGYSHGPPNYSHGYSSNYGPEHPRYSQSYRPGYNPGPPQDYTQDFTPEPRYSQRYGPGYNLGPPSYSEGYGSSYGSGNSGYSQGYELGYNPRSSHSRSHGYGGDWSDSPEPSYRPERPQGPQPIQVTHSYSQYRPPSYVTQYEYVRSPPRQTPYARTENYYYSNGDYQTDYNNRDYQNSYSNNGYVPSMFSEENPNACTIS